MKLIKLLLKLKFILISALSLAALTIAIPIGYNKLFRSFIAPSVFIVKDINEKRGSGTGFIVENSKGQRLFITNNHVCEGLIENGNILAASDYQDGEKFVLKVITTDKENDLCVAQAPSQGRALPISLEMSRGDIVHIFGHPIGFDLHKTSGEIIGSKTIEIMSGTSIFDMQIHVMRIMQTSTPTSPGNSGSPVVDHLGRVVGVLFAGSNVNSYTSFFIPAAKLHALIESL